jgi:ATP phosphoribosyltransferase
MSPNETLRTRIAIQKSGRLFDKSLALLTKSGLNFDFGKDNLFAVCRNFPVDLMLVRDDDIPKYVADGVCELGIVGKNVLEECRLGHKHLAERAPTVLLPLDFGRCRLSLAVPDGLAVTGPVAFNGLRIATSYPGLLGDWLAQNGVRADIIELSGSVELAPKLKVADAICDLVSTGATLRANGLRESLRVFDSEAVLVQTRRELNASQAATIESLSRRMVGVVKAAQTKYIMMNAPKTALPAIQKILPGMEEPSIMTLAGTDERVAIHAVAREAIFWETMEELKRAGASSILVLPIEKIVD